MGFDKFENEYTVVGCKDKKGKGYPSGFFEFKGQLFKVEPSPSNKEGVDMWVRITVMKKRAASNFGGGKKSSSFGNK